MGADGPAAGAGPAKPGAPPSMGPLVPILTGPTPLLYASEKPYVHLVGLLHAGLFMSTQGRIGFEPIMNVTSIHSFVAQLHPVYLGLYS